MPARAPRAFNHMYPERDFVPSAEVNDTLGQIERGATLTVYHGALMLDFGPSTRGYDAIRKAVVKALEENLKYALDKERVRL